MVPKMRTSAAILYAIYCAMTLLQILFYRLGVLFGWGEITWFDSLCLAFGTAGTGGFSVRNSGLADYSAYLQAVTTVFMVLFGVNFSVYFFLLRRRFKLAWHNSEVRWYFIIIFGAIVLISANLLLTAGSSPPCSRRSTMWPSPSAPSSRRRASARRILRNGRNFPRPCCSS